ncbi:MAG TPA: ribonuclease HI family protein [Candidatus Gracilibacteria bacterium]|nr:ribonuclease HI family protein [Candidatus Gracilibacteria bacterium]
MQISVPSDLVDLLTKNPDLEQDLWQYLRSKSNPVLIPQTGDLVVFTDGGARGNPGPAASAYVIMQGEQKIAEGGEYLGVATNNQAEYHALELALKVIDPQCEKVVFCSDSELIVKQIQGIYQIKDENLKKYYNRIKLKWKNSFIIKHIPRSQNKLSDQLVNKIIDQKSN